MSKSKCMGSLLSTDSCPWWRFGSDSSAAKAKLQDCRQVSKGHGWGDTRLDRAAKYPSVQDRFGFFTRKAATLGNPGRPLPGKICTSKCKDKDRKILANCAGFSPPDKDSNVTTVYVLGSDPLAWMVVSQYAYNHPRPLFFVSHRECLACTVLERPFGSIIAGSMPPVKLIK